jgi:thymidylate kinase
MILVLEGMDCAGKTTLAKEIQRQWNDIHHGTSSIHKFPTRDFNPEWSAEDFFNDFRKNIPWEEHDTKHLCIIDRLWMSTLVYQRVDAPWLAALINAILPITMTAVLFVPVQTFRERIDQESIDVEGTHGRIP